MSPDGIVLYARRLLPVLLRHDFELTHTHTPHPYDGKVGIIETVFVADHGLDARRYRHLKRIARKQWQSGKPVKGEHSN